MNFKNIEKIEHHTLKKIKLAQDQHVALVTLHNPPVNAIDGEMQEEILKVCHYLSQQKDIWVCILNSDLKTFCVGVDIHRFKQSIAEDRVSEKQQLYYDGALALYDLPIPLITAVHGHCLGGGLCYPAGSDIAIAAAGTLFGVPEVNLSVVGGSGHLARILPPLVMREMAFTGRFMKAEELLAFGGLTQVVQQDDLLETAYQKAMELCQKGPLVLRELKACMNAQEDYQMLKKNALEVKHTKNMSRSEDFSEALTAFLEKRTPNYLGK